MKFDWRQALPALALGLVLGAALGRWAHWRHHPRDPQARHARMVERFNRALDLSDQQKPKVSAILETKRRKLDALRTEAHPRFEEIRRSAKEDIRKILTQDQLPKFEKLEAEWAARWEKRHGKVPRL